jgi:TonB family protein
METRAKQFMIFLCVICMGSMATALPQDQLEVKKSINPWYPSILKAAGIEGEAWLKVFINEKGSVEKAEVIKTTHPAFAEAAIEAVKQWEFSPAMKDGKPLKSEVTIPFRFKLADSSLKSHDAGLLELEENVRRLLRGEAVESLKDHIGAEAYAVVGHTYGSLSSFIAERAKRDMLVGGPDAKVEMSHSILGDAGDMAYLMVKTRPAAGKPERYHTVIFMKSPKGTWTISAWHAGS